MQQQRFQWRDLTMGVCYYPEHWPKELWKDDLRRMKEAGISVIRIGEFCWTIFEPYERNYDFTLYDGFLSLCEEEGMKVIFGTPTATPPAWVTEKYPQTLNARMDGTLLRHGCRRHYTYNSPIYQSLCRRIVEQLARHFGKHPAIVGWQIDNELNCETDEFYSDADHRAFEKFVQKKYGTLDALNEAWGTVVWSQTYTDWNEIHCPRPVVNGGHNPHLMLDYYRFVSDSCIRFAEMQAEILRKYQKPGDFITTNGLFGNLDNHCLENTVLDVYTYDSYPNFAFELDKSPRTSTDLNDRKWSRNLTEVRSVCPHFGIMEQQSGGGGWVNRMEMPSPRPGQLKLWAMQSVAQGADFVSFFRWRTATAGTEIYWHGILDYDSRDNRKLAEVKEFGKLLKAIGPVCGAENKAAFALLKDYDNEWDARLDTFHRRIARQSEAEIFAAAELNHTPYDILYLTDETRRAELEKYPVLIWPHPVIVTEKRAEVLKEYVDAGGTLIIGCRSGYKDISGRCVMMPQPGLLQKITGTDVREFSFASPNEDPVTARWNGESVSLPVCNDVLTPCLENTAVLAYYENSYFAWEPAVTEHRSGKGRAVHVGSTFTRDLVRRLFAHTGILEPFRETVTGEEGVELVMREKEGRTFLFALNFQNVPQKICLHCPAVQMETGEEVQGEIVLQPFGTEVYEMKG